MRAMDSNKKKVMDRRVKEHQKVFRPRNKDVNAMKAMKVTMKAMKLRVSRPDLHKALQKITLQKIISSAPESVKNNSVNEKWHRK